MDALLRDVRFAFRLIRKAPALSLATIATLALGVGLNAGVFTVLDGMLFRPRVTADPASFVRLQPVYSGTRIPRHESEQLTTADYQALRERSTTLRLVTAWTVTHARFGPESADALTLAVSCDFFELYGLDRFERGRGFQGGECAMPAAPVAVISDEVWRRHFGADPEIIGKPLLLNGQTFVVIGVTPPQFPGRVKGEGIWVPYTNQPALMRGASIYNDAGTAWLWVEGRLQRGTSREVAQAEANVLIRQQDALTPGRATAIAITNGAMIHEPQVASIALFVVPLVLGSVALVLLLACGNVALLLLSRAVVRRREIAVRLAIGCSRGRLLRMLLTESVVFALLGVPLSAWLARAAPAVLRSLIPQMPFYPMEPDAAVFGYLTAATFTAGALAGLTPALESLRQRLVPALGGIDTPFGGASRSRNILIASQIGMSVVLLAGAALFLRVEQSLRTPDPTADAGHVLLANYDPPRAASAALFAGTIARLAALPGVRSVAFARGSSGDLGGEGSILTVGGLSAPAQRAAINVVSAPYFATLNRQIVRGRALHDGDARGPARGLVLSEALAEKWWPGGGGVGARIEAADGGLYDVVGVVRGDVALAGASFDPRQAYTLADASPGGGLLLIRFDGDAASVQPRVRAVLRDLGPASAAMPITLAAAQEAMATTFLPLVDMVGALGLTAIVLAIVGLYGVVSFMVSRRAREIGVRMALGATRADIMRLILSTGIRPVAAGLAGGFVLVVPGAIALSRVFAQTPVPLRAGDPLPYAIVAVVLGIAALATMIGPARRAAAVAPSVSLRAE